MHTGVAMTITTLSSREFNQGASEAKRAANDGPVFMTNRGKPAHVLLSFDDYQKLTKQQRKFRLWQAWLNLPALKKILSSCYKSPAQAMSKITKIAITIVLYLILKACTEYVWPA